MILSDFDLRSYISSGRLYIDPFDPSIVRENGLDLRLGRGFCELVETFEVLDPYSLADLDMFYRCSEADEFVLRPWGRYLLHTLEYIRLPPRACGLRGAEINTGQARTPDTPNNNRRGLRGRADNRGPDTPVPHKAEARHEIPPHNTGKNINTKRETL
jgi:Deoxycytidine deaminase